MAAACARAPIRRALVALALVMALALAGSAPARAEVVTAFGAGGASGADGVAGEDGQPGEDGETVLAEAGSTDPSNRALAEGGFGGRGGDGGEVDGSGGRGGAGGDATAIATTQIDAGQAEAVATATGGAGTPGGRLAAGGAGLDGPSGDAGDAHATAVAINANGSATARAVATGGQGGGASGPITIPAEGGRATASLTARGTSAASAFVTVTGGDGGSGLFDSRYAESTSGNGATVELDDSVATLSASDPDADYRLNVVAVGGAGGVMRTAGRSGNGGDAIVDLSRSGQSGSSYQMSLTGEGGESGSANLGGVPGGTFGRAGISTVTGSLSFGGDASLSVSSSGGRGGSTTAGVGLEGGDGGAALGEARVESFSAGSQANADVEVYGGRGGGGASDNGDGGVASGTASATATPTGVASAQLRAVGGSGGSGSQADAQGGDGAAVTLVDAVSGTGGSVVLEQIAQGGGGGGGGLSDGRAPTGGRGGAASSTLAGSNPIGDLSLSVSATGGGGGENGGPGAAGFASAVGEALGDVVVSASATSGAAGSFRDTVPAYSTDGVAATLGVVRGTSTGGGSVEVIGRVRGADGGSGFAHVGSGADAILVDAISGETTGTLRLWQHASGGHAGGTLQSVEVGAGGRGGDAHSELNVEARSSQLETELEAWAGDSRGRDPAGLAIAGGAATSRAVLRNESGGIDASYRSIAGDGGHGIPHEGPNGDGGAASATLSATTVGDGQGIRITSRNGTPSTWGAVGGAGGSLISQPTPTGGGAAGEGGAAVTTVEGMALGDSEVDVEARATGGAGGDPLGDGLAGSGGAASARADGRNAGSSAVFVWATAQGGLGGGTQTLSPSGTEAMGGAAQASAYGESTGGGDVTVRARAQAGGSRNGRGADATMRDAVSGRTSGALHLVQEAFGGGLDPFVNVGHAGAGRSELSVDDDQARLLVLESIARGGHGRVAGSAHAAASGIGVGEVSVLARAIGGNGRAFFPTGDAAGATLGRVYGESRGGGLVRVVGEAVAGMGATANPTPGRGGDVVVEDAVDGETTGRLELVQRATGGDAGAGVWQTDVEGGARGGSATNRLTRSVRAGELALELSALGGAGSDRARTAGDAIRGGDAVAEAATTNPTGSATLHVESVGGMGGIEVLGTTNRRGGDGGHAQLIASARTLTDGAAITIGGDDGTRRWGAWGGDVRELPSVIDPARGSGGHATSRSVGIALGDSRVAVEDRAFGGDGYSAGGADSTAIAENAGGADVSASAYAEAGRPSAVGRPGDATARASSHSASGASDARARARTALANRVYTSGAAPRAHALSDAIGTTASAESRAYGATGAFGAMGVFVEARALATGGRSLSAEALVGGDAARALASTRNAASVSTGAHARNGEWGRFGLHLAASEQGPDIVLRADVGFWVDSAVDFDSVFVSFYDLRIDSSDFAQLAFRILDGDTPLLERVFADSAAARLFFASPIELGALLATHPFDGELAFSLEGHGGAADAGFGLLFSVGTTIVPEPGTGLLLGIGLALLGATKRSASR